MIEDRLRAIRERISAAASRAGRDPQSVRMLAVTKTHPRSVVDEARRAGINLFGENRVQEAASKYGDIAESVELHLVGHLQRNKAKMVPGLFSWVESIDALATAQALSKRCEAAGWRCSVLVQYNSSGETSKSGYEDESLLLDEAEQMAGLAGLDVRGLMTIGPFVSDQAKIASAFARTRLLYERLRGRLGEAGVDTLSMGMTDDFEIAIAEGSTEVRIGSALFGARS